MKTYSELCEQARLLSIDTGYAAVVDVVRYMQSSSKMTVVGSRMPIKTRSHRGEFVGVMAQFKDGVALSYGNLTPANAITPEDGAELPF